MYVEKFYNHTHIFNYIFLVNNIGDAGAVYIADMLMFNSALVDLYIDGKIAYLKYLYILIVFSCIGISISDTGCKQIAYALWSNTSIEALSLSGIFILVLYIYIRLFSLYILF